MLRIILTVILLGLLTACGIGVPAPGGQLVQKAIALQVSQTQKQLSQQLFQQPSSFEIAQIRVTHEEPLLIQKLPAYHIQGTYNFTLQRPNHQVTQQQNHFDIYLQRQIEGKTWRLAIPQSTNTNTEPTWRTWLIQ
ncbi:hypothetical protein NDI44_02595 [Trichocoleus sp. DQ-A3]|uniref:hypothetical protein n=1 Tax=Cyanophyceae TaxID=3028117 RepID=UPI0016831EBA|nr:MULTISPECIES: hypothetical protein [unclassified Coleofasciculus]MBD1901746.1 hypothetical protein [Coleofasciculus sp. FACHB-125]MBD2084644.1 hypothetical protein [Coleofasciculus sp. FACHB-542]